MNDLIYKEQAIESLNLNKPNVDEKTKYAMWQFDKDLNTIKTMPAADAEEVRYGKWLYTDVVHIVTGLIYGDAPQSLTCSRCGFKHKFADEYGYSCIWHYCPNCGARMEAP